jgi:hypothetical protein
MAANSFAISEPPVAVKVGGILIKAEQLKLDGTLGRIVGI